MDASKLIFALDMPSESDARAMALRMRDAVGMFKVGLELFVEAGPRAVEIGREAGRPVFLDLKLHDIPETVDRAVARAAGLGASLLTVHASGGRRMLREAARRADKEGTGLQIVAVTVLTSLDGEDLASLGLPKDPRGHALRLAKLAHEEGVSAFVCSPHEASTLRAALGSAVTIITPGVRPAGDGKGAKDDQKRTMTAGEAIREGANLVVVGRPIRDAKDPVEAARAITRELEEATVAMLKASSK